MSSNGYKFIFNSPSFSCHLGPRPSLEVALKSGNKRDTGGPADGWHAATGIKVDGCQLDLTRSNAEPGRGFLFLYTPPPIPPFCPEHLSKWLVCQMKGASEPGLCLKGLFVFRCCRWPGRGRRWRAGRQLYLAVRPPSASASLLVLNETAFAQLLIPSGQMKWPDVAPPTPLLTARRRDFLRSSRVGFEDMKWSGSGQLRGVWALLCALRSFAQMETKNGSWARGVKQTGGVQPGFLQMFMATKAYIYPRGEREGTYPTGSVHWLASCPPAKWRYPRSWWSAPGGICRRWWWCWSPSRWCPLSRCWRSRRLCLAPRGEKKKNIVVSWSGPLVCPTFALHLGVRVRLRRRQRAHV